MFSATRSLLYVPAHKPRMLAKVGALGADAYVVDLEDGVAPAAKAEARLALREACAAGLSTHRQWALRINGLDTPWFEEDVALATELRPVAVVIPKAESTEPISKLAATFADNDMQTLLMIETAAGLGRVRELAGCASSIAALIYGSADLRLSLGARPDRERGWERHALSEILLAARIHGCAAIDAVTFQFRDLDALAHDASIARSLGFDGKSCIHPAQLDVIHRVFSSTPAELAWAARVLAAWEAQGGAEAGVIDVDGEMIEALHLDVARRILDRAPRQHDEPQ